MKRRETGSWYRLDNATLRIGWMCARRNKRFARRGICDPPDTVRRHRVGRRISPSALSRQMHHATRSGSKSEAMLGELWYEVDKKMI